MKKKFKKILKNLSFIDWIFVLLFLFISIFSLFRFRRKKAVVYVDLTFKHQEWLEYPLPPEYWQIVAIKPGDVGYNSMGRKVAEIVEVNKMYWGADRSYLEMVITLEGTYDNNIHSFVFDGNPVLIGQELSLNFGKTKFVGLVSRVYEKLEDRFSDYRLATGEILVKYRNFEPWHAEAVKDFKVRNSEGEIILETVKAEILPAEMITTNDKGEVFRQFHPIKKDVILTMKLNKLLCDELTCYFNNYQPLKIGHEFWASSERTYIDAMTKEDPGSIVDMKIKYLD